MCFGGTPKYEPSPAPAVTPAPIPTPAPTASPTPIESPTPTTIAAADRRKKIAAVRYGMMSTIKTSPQGIPAAGALYAPETGKKKLLGE